MPPEMISEKEGLQFLHFFEHPPIGDLERIGFLHAQEGHELAVDADAIHPLAEQLLVPLQQRALSSPIIQLTLEPQGVQELAQLAASSGGCELLLDLWIRPRKSPGQSLIDCASAPRFLNLVYQRGLLAN